MKLKRLRDSSTAHRFLTGYLALLFLLIFIDPFFHRHTEFVFEKLLFFFPLYGFGSCMLLFGVTKMVSRLFKRDVDYYEQ